MQTYQEAVVDPELGEHVKISWCLDVLSVLNSVLVTVWPKPPDLQ
jgi:hypothetical protein